jgi:hypothetical protein
MFFFSKKQKESEVKAVEAMNDAVDAPCAIDAEDFIMVSGATGETRSTLAVL